MKLTRLKIVDVRAIASAEFHFQPDFNLIAGVNGVGKTTVLDTLAVCFSAIVRNANHRPRYGKSFVVDDIRVGRVALQAECDIECTGKSHSYRLQKFRDHDALSPPKEWSREIASAYLSDIGEFLGGIPTDSKGGKPEGQVLAVSFSTNRSILNEQRSGSGTAAGGVDAAFADALSARPLRLGEFADWMRAQQALSSELPTAKRMLVSLDKAVTRFLPGYQNLRPADDGGNHSLLIDRGTTALSVRHLSDGERGVLAMVLDLARRLAQANPGMEDPAAEAEAVVLIDEIELHLHPAWQRRIIKNLTDTFPRCQFIVTTHSPQVLGEVDHDRIQIIADGQVYMPTHSFGVDSSRVLEEIMETPARTKDVEDILTKISHEIGKQRYENTHGLLIKLVDHLGESDPEVTRIRTLLDFMDGEE